MAEELSRWLRLVRPATAADDDWTESAPADDVLTAVHRTITRSRTGQARRRRICVSVATIGAATAVVVLAATTGTGDTPRPPGAGPGLPALRPAAMLLAAYRSCDDLLDGLRSHTEEQVGRTGFGGPQFYSGSKLGPLVPTTSITTGLASGLAGSSAAVPDMSTTNVQEIGVDEPDIVKVDGGDIVTLTAGVLRVVDAAGRDVLGTLDLTAYAGWQDAQLLVHDDHALVIMGEPSGYGYGRSYLGPVSGQNDARSTVLFVDLHGQPSVTGSMRVSGVYLDARQIGTTVRLVASSPPRISIPGRRTSLDTSRDVIGRAPLSSWLPTYTVTSGAVSTSKSVPCDQVRHPDKYTGMSMLTVYTLDLDNLGTDPDPVSIAADGDTVYASSTSLYVTSNPDWYCCRSTSQQTEVHRFDISGSGRPTYLGSGTVPGRLLSQYSLSEYDHTLRIATTSGEPASANGVYVLDAATLETTGHVDNLGAGEQIYAVRFVGPMAYVVTFRRTDPLYLVDLHDPAHPKVTGTLELTGYSGYLHDAGDGRLIGVGQDATQAGQVNGLQVSLFDVSDPATPSRTGHVALPGAVGEDRFDPHAFLYWAQTGLVVVPTPAWSSGEAGKVLVCTVAGNSLTEVGTLANPVETGTTDDRQGIERSMMVGDELWTISSTGIQAVDPTTLDRSAWIAFPTP